MIKKTAKMRSVERAFSRPVEVVLEELYRTRTLQETAIELKNMGVDVSIGTLSVWFLKFGIGTRRWAHPEEMKGSRRTPGGRR
ncbi:MAG: hypothetical protein M1335_06215 [Chloroflexi bacterium]|nr:hypothetical protein [Chloroflexota bacterium]